MRPTPGALSLLAIVCAGAVGAGIWLAGMAQDCHARWHRSGFAYEYRDHTCFVQAGSRWVPSSAVRVHVRANDQPDMIHTTAN